MMNIQRHPTYPLYDTDIHAWAQEQRAALEGRNVDALDWSNLVEEIGDLANSLVREMENRLNTILEHLLKYEYGVRREPERGWARTIATQKAQLARLLKRNPSLVPQLQEIAAEVYPDARRDAMLAFNQYEPDDLAFYSERLPATLPYEPSSLMDPDAMLPEPRERD